MSENVNATEKVGKIRKRVPIAKAVGTTEKTVGATDKATSTVSEVVESFTVASKGYKETFKTLELAQEQAATLKKRAIKGQTAVNIKVTAKMQDDSKDRLVSEVKIDEDFYE